MIMLLHTGDWHLKIPENNESFYIKRFMNFIYSLLEYEPEYIAITGDLFDKSPCILEVSLMIWALTLLSEESFVMVIPGNHDVGNKRHKAKRYHYLNAIFDNLKFGNIIYSDDILEYKDFLLVSNQYIRSKQKIPKSKCPILLSHIRHELTFGDKTRKAEYNLNEISQNFDLCLLSDIHTTFEYLPNVFYSASPYRTTIKTIKKFNEIDDSFFGFNVVDLVTLEVNHKELYLPNHYKLVTDKDGQEQKYDGIIDYIYEMDLDQLRRSNQSNVKLKRNYSEIHLQENLYDMIQDILISDYGIKEPEFYMTKLLKLVGDI